MDNQAAAQPIITWALIIVSVLLVAGITYVYTNRNRRLTTIFTLFSILTVGLIKLISIVHEELSSHFIGGYDEMHMPYVTSEPGWKLLVDSWHFWILPVIFCALIFLGICYAIYHHYQIELAKRKPEIKPDDGPNISKTTSAVQAASSKTPYNIATRAEKLSTFMAMDAVKHESQHVHEQLSEALLTNAAYEIKLSDLNFRIHELEQELASAKHDLGDEVKTLQLELSAKIKENDYLASQLTERSNELAQAQDMFEKLLALQQENEEENEEENDQEPDEEYDEDQEDQEDQEEDEETEEPEEIEENEEDAEDAQDSKDSKNSSKNPKDDEDDI